MRKPNKRSRFDKGKSRLTGIEIARWRVRMGISQIELARCFCRPPHTIKDWELGAVRIPKEVGQHYRRMFILSDYLLASRDKPDWSL